MNAIHQGFLRVRLTGPETGFFHQALEFYYQKYFDVWLPRSGSLDGLRAQVQAQALQEEMTFNLWESGAHALLQLFEKEPVFPDDSTEEEKEKGKVLMADLLMQIKKNIEKLTICTHI